MFCPAKDCFDLACMDCAAGVDAGFLPCFCCGQAYCDSHTGGDCVVCAEPYSYECMSSCASCQQPVCPKHLPELADGQQCWHGKGSDSDDSIRKEERHYLSPDYDGYN